MRCSDVAVLLSDYADNVVDERGRRIVERHVQLCAACEAELAAFQKIARQLRRTALLPMGVAARVPRYQRELEGRLLARERARRRRPLVALSVMTVVVLELAVAWLLFVMLH